MSSTEGLLVNAVPFQALYMVPFPPGGPPGQDEAQRQVREAARKADEAIEATIEPETLDQITEARLQAMEANCKIIWGANFKYEIKQILFEACDYYQVVVWKDYGNGRRSSILASTSECSTPKMAWMEFFVLLSMAVVKAQEKDGWVSSHQAQHFIPELEDDVEEGAEDEEIETK